MLLIKLLNLVALILVFCFVAGYTWGRYGLGEQILLILAVILGLAVAVVIAQLVTDDNMKWRKK